MKQEKQDRIEQVLNAWDGAKKAEAPAFFYTRLKARMLARHEGGEHEAGEQPVKSWLVKPAFVIATLVAVIVINAFIFFQDGNSNTITTSPTEESIQSIAAEYNLSDITLEEINQ
jgi:hypothetical protein